MGSDGGHATNVTINSHRSHLARGAPFVDRLTDHHKEGLILIMLSAIIYLACQFYDPLNFVIPEDVEGPKPTTKIKMIALIGERNSGTRWTSE
jgi:hypothetical protein